MIASIASGRSSTALLHLKYDLQASDVRCSSYQTKYMHTYYLTPLVRMVRRAARLNSRLRKLLVKGMGGVEEWGKAHLHPGSCMSRSPADSTMTSLNSL